MREVYRWFEAPGADFAVIGDPVGHSLSPQMHAAAYSALNLPYRYMAIHVGSGEVALALDHLKTIGYIGVNVTVPHKEEALAWAENVEPLAARVRAANTIKLTERSCINTDAPGFLDTLAGFHFSDKAALVLGAGGSARAVAVALADAGYRLRLYNRTRSKADALAEELGIASIEVLSEADPAGVALIVNTTSASLANESIPIHWRLAEPDALAYDLMYAEEPTHFMRAAAVHGLKAMDGRHMLAAQGARAFEWWLGIEAPRQAMLEALV